MAGGLATTDPTITAQPPRGRRRSRRWAALAVGLALVAVVGVVVWRSQDAGDIAGSAVVTASSTAAGFSAPDVVSGSADDPGNSWQSDNQTTGAWIELSWSQTYVLHQIVIVRNPVTEPGVTAGFLTFGDGSTLQVNLSTTARATTLPFSPRTTDRVRFTAGAVSSGARNVTVSEIRVTAGDGAAEVVSGETPDGNAVTKAVLTQSADAGAGDARALQDGSGQPTAAGAGADWTIARPTGAWVQMSWDRPRELSSVALVGSTRSAAALAKATVTFSDGAQLPIGAVLPDPTRPTIVAFMPRVATSVRISFDGVSGSGSLTLGELRAYERGTMATRSSSTAAVQGTLVAADQCGGPAAGSRPAGPVVDCPQAGSTADTRVVLRALLPLGYTAATAAVWPGDPTAATPAPIRSVPDATGTALLPVTLVGQPAGPLTISVEATGAGKPTKSVDFPLYHQGPPPGDLASSAATRGRSLAYAEEFDQPVSITRTGAGADYAAGKPVAGGVQDFGDAIFADPAKYPDNVSVVDGRYLRIELEPSTSDPQGYHRAYNGGMLASARPGGSGFSAQYGYFEARMLAPAAPGTWPAFWVLPSDGLVTPTDSGAEIDAAELYGQFPERVCHSTHQYTEGKNVDGIALCGPRFPTDRAAVAWHTYGVSITPSANVFYIDGKVVGTAPQVAGGGSPMFFMTNLALGGGWPIDLSGTKNRTALYVDYIRVYV